MARPKKIVVEGESVEEAVAINKVVGVYSDSGQLIRSYSSDTHGKDYKALAEEFSSQYPGSTVR